MSSIITNSFNKPHSNLFHLTNEDDDKLETKKKDSLLIFNHLHRSVGEFESRRPICCGFQVS